MKSKEVPRYYEFDSFRLDAQKRVLWRAGEPITLTPRALDLLFALVERREQVVEKDDLLTLLWPDTVVEENNLTVNVSALRKALGVAPGERRYIVTVPGRGYRFVGEVRELTDAAPALVLEESQLRMVIEEEWESDKDRAIERQPNEALAQSEVAALLPQHTGEIVRPRFSLKQIGVVAGIVTLLLAPMAYWWMNKQSAGRLSAKPQSVIKSLAVLPFKPLLPEGRDEFLQLGMADVLIVRLSNLRQVIVRPTSAIRHYTALDQDPVAAGRELKVDAVLDGHLQRAGERVRLTVRLVNTRDGAPLWAETFDEKYTDLFTVEDRLSAKLVAALALQLSPVEERLLSRRYTENGEAFQAYLKGRYFLSHWSGDGLQKAIDYFEQAIRLEPNYAQAHSGLADAYILQGYLGFVSPRTAFPKAAAAAQTALQLDDALGEAHLSLAKTKLFYDWDFAGAERATQRALALAPHYADAHSFYGAYLTAVGRLDEALAERQRGLELNPLSPLVTTMVGWVYFYQRRYDQAIEWYRKALELNPQFPQAQEDLGLALYMKGDYEQAIPEMLKARALFGVSPAHLAALRQAFVTAGKTGYWRKELELAKAQTGRVVSLWRMARIYAELGDKDRAFAALEQAYDERVSLLTFLKVIPIFESLHSDPRFADLLRRIGFPS